MRTPVALAIPGRDHRLSEAFRGPAIVPERRMTPIPEALKQHDYLEKMWAGELETEAQKRKLLDAQVEHAESFHFLHVLVSGNYFRLLSMMKNQETLLSTNPSVVAFSSRVRTFDRSSPLGTSATISNISVTSLPGRGVSCSTIASTAFIVSSVSLTFASAHLSRTKVRRDFRLTLLLSSAIRNFDSHANDVIRSNGGKT
jgi:hypothetical protein